MSHLREDPEIDSVLQTERNGSGVFASAEEDATAKLMRLEIERSTPRPGPNYYSFNEHRIYCENNSERRERLVRQLEAYYA